MISPTFNRLSEKYPNVVFLKVDVDEMQVFSKYICSTIERLQGTARQCGITAMPTFQFFHKTQKIDEFKGADPNKLEQTIDRHSKTYSGGETSGTKHSNLLGLMNFL